VEVPTRREVGASFAARVRRFGWRWPAGDHCSRQPRWPAVLDSTGHLRFQITPQNTASAPHSATVDGDGGAILLSVMSICNGQGDLLWFTVLDGCFLAGALPLMPMPTRTAITKCISDCFNNAIRASSRWTPQMESSCGSPIPLQSYRSTVIADLEWRRPKMRFCSAIKISSLFCLDGRRPAALENATARSGNFSLRQRSQLCKARSVHCLSRSAWGSGTTGKSLYALGPEGNVLDAFGLTWGRPAASPMLCKDFRAVPPCP